MSKRLDKMRRNPRGDWSISDVKAICREFNVTCESARSGSSHYKVSHHLVDVILTIPFKRPIKPVYIRKLVAFIEAVRNTE